MAYTDSAAKAEQTVLDAEGFEGISVEYRGKVYTKMLLAIGGQMAVLDQALANGLLEQGNVIELEAVRVRILGVSYKMRYNRKTQARSRWMVVTVSLEAGLQNGKLVEALADDEDADAPIDVTPTPITKRKPGRPKKDDALFDGSKDIVSGVADPDGKDPGVSELTASLREAMGDANDAIAERAARVRADDE